MIDVIPEVGDCMTPGPHFVAASDTLAQAKKLMDEYGIRHLPIMSGRELVGILSDRDLERALALTHRAPDAITVEEAMTPNPYSVPPNAPLNQVARTMAERKVGSAIVQERGVVAGVFTTTDALHALADTLEGTIVRHIYESVTTAPPGGRRANEPDVP